MAARARRPAHLAVVDTITERNHFSCRAFGNGKAAHRRRTGIGTRALWWLCAHVNWITGRSGHYARARLDLCGTAVGGAAIHDPVYPSTRVIGNVEGTIRPDRQATWTMLSVRR